MTSYSRTPVISLVSVLLGLCHPTQGLYAGTPPLASPAFFVSNDGNDSNSGTQAAPFATLEAAQAAMRGSRTAKTTYLREGIYRRTAALALERPDAGTSWLAYPGETPVLDGGNAVKRAITLGAKEDSSHVTIDHLTIQNYTGSGIDGQAIEHCAFTNNTIQNIGAPSTNYAGIYLHFKATNCAIVHNLIRHVVGPGIVLAAGGAVDKAFSFELVFADHVVRERDLH